MEIIYWLELFSALLRNDNINYYYLLLISSSIVIIIIII